MVAPLVAVTVTVYVPGEPLQVMVSGSVGSMLMGGSQVRPGGVVYVRFMRPVNP